jgi:NTP pyrophosphatase (non-canonical NTP hydrolase)
VGEARALEDARLALTEVAAEVAEAISSGG